MIASSDFEKEINTQLCKQIRLRIEQACFATGYIPNYILLDSTRNIHSYIEYCNYQNGKLFSSHWDSESNDGLINLLRTQYSQLDRPLFFIFKIDGVFRAIESSPIREHLLENRDNNISQFFIEHSDPLREIIPQIIQEL